MWKVASGALRLRVEKEWTQRPPDLVAKTKEKIGGTPWAEEMWGARTALSRSLIASDATRTRPSSPKLPPCRAGASWNAFLTGCSRTSIGRPSVRVHEVKLWREIAECVPEIQAEESPVRFALTALQVLAGLTGQWADHAEEESDARSEPVVPPPPVSWESKEEGTRALAAPAASAERTRLAGAQLASGLKMMTVRCLWWTMIAARDYRVARDASWHHLYELTWMEHQSVLAAAARRGPTATRAKPMTFIRVADQMRADSLRDDAL
ncbi:hypothetical protein Esti_000910 [Eimeria stiedai]